MSKYKISEKILPIILVMAAVLAIYTAFCFNMQEAAVINGQSIEVNDGWKLTGEDIFKDLDINLPRAIRLGEERDPEISRHLNSSFSGMMLEVTVKNADIKASLDNTEIYDGTKNKNGPKDLIALPDIREECTLKISFTPKNLNSSIYVGKVTAARGDTAIIRQIKNSLIPLLCCVVILICATVMATLELLRKRSRWKEKNLHRQALYFILILIYSAIGTGIPVMIYGNSTVFTCIQGIAIAATPAVLAFNNVEDIYPINIRESVLQIATAFIAVLALLLSIIPAYLPHAEKTAFILIGIIILHNLISVVMRRTQMWGLETGAYILAFIFCIKEFINPGTMINVIVVTLSVFILTAYQTSMLIKEYREKVEESEKEAIRANEAKGAFLANMSHEIRTPINAVLGMDEMILRESGDPEIKSYAMDIYSAGHTLLSIINDILDLSKIESGKMDLVPTGYDTVTLLKDTVNMTIPKAREKGLTFKVMVSPEIPAALYGDDVRIRQVMMNLLSNAVKYTEKGEVRLSVAWKPEGEKEGRLYVKVKDTGIGMKDTDIPKLFEKYSRFDEALHKHTEGTGLGMNITMNILSLMGSNLDVKSAYGKGSVFSFEVKQRIINPEVIGDFKEKIKSNGVRHEYQGKFTAPDAHILIVDDNVMNKKVFRSLLKDTELQITEAGSGSECLKNIKKTHFDMIFMDHMMPDMDGIETLKRMKGMKDNKSKDTPVYILTANAIVGAKEEYLSKGFDGYLSKPIIPDKLEEAIIKTLPKELLKAAGERREKPKTQTILSIDIPGIDKDYLSLHFKDTDTQLSAIKEFLRGAGISIKKLDSIFKELDTGDGIKQYRIQVHGMKSAASTIGAMPIYGMAKALEDEAKKGNRDAICSLHPVFKEIWITFTDSLAKAMGFKKRKMKTAEPALIEKELTALCKAIKDMDIEKADRIMERLSAYSYEGEVKALIEELSTAVNDIDTDQVEETTEKIRSYYAEANHTGNRR